MPSGTDAGTVVEIGLVNVWPFVLHGSGTCAVPPVVTIPAAVPAASGVGTIVSVAPGSKWIPLPLYLTVTTPATGVPRAEQRWVKFAVAV